MSTPSIPRIGSTLLVWAAGSILAGACGGGQEPLMAQGSALLLDATSSPLSVGNLHSINGTYGQNCTDRSGSWSLAFQDS